MIIFLLIVIITILLFGGTAVLGVVGLVLGGIATVAAITYVGIHYGIDHDQAFWGFIGLCTMVSVVAGYFSSEGTPRSDSSGWPTLTSGTKCSVGI